MKATVLLPVLLFVCCSGNPAKKETEEKKPAPAFSMVDIPGIITDPAERADYLVTHYWNNFDFSDTVYVNLPEVSEQAFADYLDIMPYASYPVVCTAIKAMIKQTEKEPVMYKYFTELYEKYLYDPNSPFRNDEYYIPALEAMLESPLTEEKVRPAHLLALARKNRTGEKATDFVYTLKDGKKSSLYALRSDYTLIFFYNPGCPNCKETIGQIRNSPVLNSLSDRKMLAILAVYPDEDLTEWEHYLSDIPVNWINSYDRGTHLKNEEIYDLKAIPTMFLLDKDKKVILKDTAFEQLENYLQQQTF